MARRTRLLALVSAALALAACDSTVRPIDGGGDAATGECASCHGDATRPGDPLVRSAPPASPLGGDGGAHLAHLAGGTYRAPLACAECHDVPSVRNHADGAVGVAMVGLADLDGATPAWNDVANTCSGVYCHGATLGGGPAATPAWGSASGLGCASCHGAPPPAPHPAGASCGACHVGYTAYTVNKATHIDGTVQAAGGHSATYDNAAEHGPDAMDGLAGCLGCHGSDANGGTSGVSCNVCHGGTAWQTDCTFCHGTDGGSGAPPVDTQGRSSRSFVAVGAHAPHVGTSMTAPLACGVCHPARGNVLADPAHANGVAEVTFGTRAGASAVYTRVSDTSATCASTACHGTATVEWTNTTPLGCTSCHGAPPPPPHTSSTDCATCHTGYTSSTVDPATHVDGTVQSTGGHAAGYGSGAVHGYEANRIGFETCRACHGGDLTGGSGFSCNLCHVANWQTNCTFCHGTAGVSFAPPVDTQGRNATTLRSVGAHASHVTTTWMTPLACTQCHADRSASNVTTDGAHIDGDGVAEVVFAAGSLARTGGAAAAYAEGTGQCSSTYCHGQFTGGSGADPTWTTATGPTPATCTSCHGNPPGSGEHSKHVGSERIACYVCHNAVVNQAGTGFVNAALHVNGTDNVSFGGTWSGETGTISGTWTPPNTTYPTGRCSNLTCHSSKSW